MQALSYEQWDLIADAYIPLLLFCVLFELGLFGRRYGALQGAKLFASALANVGLIYTVMAIDNTWALWPQLALDYSTHTALALALGMHLSLVGRTVAVLFWGSMGLYCLLMRYQAYHTWGDMVSTAVVVLPLMLPAAYMARRVRSVAGKADLN